MASNRFSNTDWVSRESNKLLRYSIIKIHKSVSRRTEGMDFNNILNKAVLGLSVARCNSAGCVCKPQHKLTSADETSLFSM